MIYVESPDMWAEADDNDDVKLFLAGGITNCPDWQQAMVSHLRNAEVTLLNPRRADFPIHDPQAAPAQIEWEFHALRAAEAILFWFPKETLCPIVLYELGAWSITGKKIFVGTDVGYQRTQDVIIQTGLVRPDVVVVTTLVDLAAQIHEWL
jgi:hypothetical protein